MKVCKQLWEAGIDVSLEDCKRWLVFPVEGEFQRLGEIVSSITPAWKAVLLINQVLQVEKDAQRAEEIVERVSGRPLAFVVALRKYYPETKDVEVIVSVMGDEEPDYGKNSKGIVDFFLNYLRFDEGIDVDALLDPLRKLLEKDPLVEDFLRLTGIDLLLKPSDFVSRIDRAVDIFLKAKEQGLDPEKILKKWDELANNGGDRFVYLEEAVKRVASEEINSSFWKAVKETLSEKGIKVSGTGGAVAGDLFYLNLINIEGTSVDVSPMKDVLDDLSSYLRQVRPIAFFTAEEIEKVLRSIGVGKTVDADIVKKNARILASLDRFSSTYVFDNDVPIFEIVNHSEEPPEEVAKRVSSAIKEAHTEGLSGETLLEYLRKRIQS